MKAWQNYLFLGTFGHVVAIRKSSGKKVWTTSLPKTGYSLVSILVEDETVYCASAGRVFALDPGTGKFLWSNGLKGLGTSGVYLTTANSNNTDAILNLMEEEAKKRKAGASSGAAAGST